MYTFLCFSIFGYQDPEKKKSLLKRQNVLMFMIHILAFLSMYLATEDIKMLAFYRMGKIKGEAEVPREIEKQSLCVDSDIWEFLQSLIPQK